MKILINNSPEDSKLWSEKEAKDWDLIIDIPLPEIITSMVDIVSECREKIWKKYLNLNMAWEREKISPSPIYLYLGGDPKYCDIQFVWWNIDLHLPIAHKILNETDDFVRFERWRVI